MNGIGRTMFTATLSTANTARLLQQVARPRHVQRRARAPGPRKPPTSRAIRRPCRPSAGSPPRAPAVSRRPSPAHASALLVSRRPRSRAQCGHGGLAPRPASPDELDRQRCRTAAPRPRVMPPKTMVAVDVVLAQRAREHGRRSRLPSRTPTVRCRPGWRARSRARISGDGRSRSAVRDEPPRGCRWCGRGEHLVDPRPPRRPGPGPSPRRGRQIERTTSISWVITTIGDAELAVDPRSRSQHARAWSPGPGRWWPRPPAGCAGSWPARGRCRRAASARRTAGRVRVAPCRPGRRSPAARATRASRSARGQPATFERVRDVARRPSGRRAG